MPPSPSFKLVRDVSSEVNALYDYTKNLPRGSLIPHEKIEEVTGVSKLAEDGISKNPIYQKVVRKWKQRMLNEQGILPWSSYSVGYKFPTVKEQQENIPDAMERHAAKTIRKAQC